MFTLESVSRALSPRLALLVMGFLMTACATPGIELSDNMALSRRALPPPGYVDFCRRLPERCLSGTDQAQAGAQPTDLRPSSAPGVTGGQFDWAAVFDRGGTAEAVAVRPLASLTMTPTLWKTLEDVDLDINRRIIPASDIQAFGRDDYWAMPLTEGLGRLGNCKHYVLEKRAALLARGVPEGAMAIAVVATPGGEVHAVLVVSTDQGEYVLDNLSPWVTPWRKTGYTWLVRQAPGDPRHWVTVAER